MTRTDQNAVMLDDFKSKRMISFSLQSIKLTLEEHEKRSMIVIDHEMTNDHSKYDKIERIKSELICVMNNDIVEMNRLMIPHVHNVDNEPDQVFYFLNASVMMALQQEVRWAATAAQIALASKSLYKAKLSIEQFMMKPDFVAKCAQ